MKAREIDRRGQPRGPAADDQAIDYRFVHPLLTALFVWEFPLGYGVTMDLGAFLILAFFVPLGLAAFVGWAQGDEIGPWLAAAPTPVLVLLLTIPHGIYMMHTLDGTDMRQASGYLEVIFGVIMAGLSFAVGLGAGYLKRRKVRRQ